jgi:hypothetical protein
MVSRRRRFTLGSSLGEVHLEEVTLDELHLVGNAGGAGVLFALGDALGVDIHAHAGRAVLLRGGDDDAPVAATEVVHHVPRPHAGQVEHAVHDGHRRRHVGRGRLLLLCAQGRTAQQQGAQEQAAVGPVEAVPCGHGTMLAGACGAGKPLYLRRGPTLLRRHRHSDSVVRGSTDMAQQQRPSRSGPACAAAAVSLQAAGR